MRVLLDRLGLTGERRLLNPQVDGFQQAAIRRYQVPRLKQDDVAGHQFRRGNLLDHTVATNLHHRHRHALEGGHCFLGPVLLTEAQQRIENHDDSDNRRIRSFTHHAGHNGRHDQDHDHDTRELLPQNAPGALDPPLHQDIGAEFFRTPPNLLGAHAC